MQIKLLSQKEVKKVKGKEKEVKADYYIVSDTMNIWLGRSLDGAERIERISGYYRKSVDALADMVTAVGVKNVTGVDADTKKELKPKLESILKMQNKYVDAIGEHKDEIIKLLEGGKQ